MNQMSQREKLISMGAELCIQVEDQFYECGQFFRAKTVKGEYRYVIFFMVMNGYAYYAVSEKTKKSKLEDFTRAIQYGDLEPLHKDKIDLERASISVLSLLAMSQGLAFNDYLKVLWGHGNGSESRDTNLLGASSSPRF